MNAPPWTYRCDQSTLEETIVKHKWDTTAPFEPDLNEDEQKTARFLARVATEPSVSAAQVIAAFGPQFTELNLNALVERVSQGIKRVDADDMAPRIDQRAA